jgi:inosose dehydratase
MLDRFEATAALAREHGLAAAVHPHAGSFLEFEDEIERLLDGTKLDLCLDTGHAAYAGMKPDAVLRTYASRLGHVHLKDVDGAVLDRIRDRRLDFWRAIGQGVFCPLGEGVVDLPAVLDALAGYDGFATIEQDRVAGSGSPLEELGRSVRALQEARPSQVVGSGGPR